VRRGLMTLPSDTTLALISWLAARNHDELHTLITRRRLTSASCGSFRSLAHALLDSAAIRSSLAALDRRELLVLGGNPEMSEEALSALEASGFLSRSDVRVDLLIPASEIVGVSTLDSSLEPPQLEEPPALLHGDLAGAASHALTLVVSVSDLVEAVADSRLPITNDGVLTATSLKNLQTDLGAGYDVASLWRFATLAGLVTAEGGMAMVSTQGTSWRELSDAESYAVLAQGWWARVPEWLWRATNDRPGLSWDSALLRYLEYHFPLAAPTALLDTLTREAQVMGLLHESTPTPWGRALWSGDDVALSVADHLPPYAPGVFAHDDYTLLGTGPLPPTHRSILGSIASRELGGLVPRYRLTSSSVLNALQDGVGATDMPGMLERVCVNTPPATMLALIDDVARRALDLEVLSQGESTLLRTRNEGLSQELLSDPGLVVLGLKRSGDKELICFWPAERVHSTLLAASYPSLLVTDSGEPLRAALALTPAPGHDDDAGIHDAVAGLVQGAKDSADKGVPAGFHSIIEVATETKTPLEIVVTMPDGTSATVIMEPRALSAGRLRGVELKHAVEKTFPVSHITSLRAWVDEGA
jgi:hypothetical protein